MQARLGFWGAGTAFLSAEAFIEAMRKRGLGFLELLSMEMKAEGKYVSRALSFSCAEFETARGSPPALLRCTALQQADECMRFSVAHGMPESGHNGEAALRCGRCACRSRRRRRSSTTVPWSSGLPSATRYLVRPEPRPQPDAVVVHFSAADGV